MPAGAGGWAASTCRVASWSGWASSSWRLQGSHCQSGKGRSRWWLTREQSAPKMCSSCGPRAALRDTTATSRSSGLNLVSPTAHRHPGGCSTSGPEQEACSRLPGACTVRLTCMPLSALGWQLAWAKRRPSWDQAPQVRAASLAASLARGLTAWWAAVSMWKVVPEPLMDAMQPPQGDSWAVSRYTELWQSSCHTAACQGQALALLTAFRLQWPWPAHTTVTPGLAAVQQCALVQP